VHYALQRLNTFIIRASRMFSSDEAYFLKKILRLLRQHDELKVVSDQFIGPTSAKSIAAMLLNKTRIITVGDFKFGTYHFSQEPHVS
jgi:dTDP-4-dehydrorhamnose reductase